MSGVRPAANRALLHVAFLAAGAAALGSVVPAIGQETSILRGAVTEANVNDELLGRQSLASRPSPLDPQPAEAGIPTPRYRPASEGPVPDEQEPVRPRDSLFEEEIPDDTFSDETTLQPSRPPSTARQRAERARNEAARPRQSAAGRQQAEGREDTDETPTGTVRTGRIDDDIDLRVDPRAERAAAIEAIDRDIEQNPYAPLGLRLGSFIVTPTLESGLTWTSNANYEPQPQSAVLSETTLRLNAISDWSSNLATLNAFGTFRKSVSGAELDEKPAGIDGTLQLDLGNEYQALATLGYITAPESASSPVTIVGEAERPIRQTLIGSLGVEKDVGKVSFGLTGAVERDWYGDAELSTGGTLSQQDRNSTLGTLVLRGGYEISPAVTPFVEAEVGRRVYELPTDSSGFERSTRRLGARAGVEIDLGEKFSGEVSAGWIEEKFDDSRLAPISGPSVAADLAWSPLRGTIVGLTGLTTVEGATTPGESGSILYAARLNLERQMRANLTGNMAFGAAYRDYIGIEGNDLTLSAETGLTYWFSRYLGLTGRARHEQQTSSLPGRDYKVNSVFLGLRMQR
jgi:hypothetical protein